MHGAQENDGYIERCDIKDGGNIKHIVTSGQTFTPKQLQLDSSNQKLYWCARFFLATQSTS